MNHHGIALTAASAALVAVLSAAGAPATPDPAKIDALFARWTANSPGCAVGVAEKGKVVFEKAYGMADLEHDVPNTPDTIFEAGSVAKQFTAAAVLLLARDGKLSLDDPVRTYIPELPDYGKPLTIRHLLTHTSGLRDWSDVVAIGGWPRTTRVYTQAQVLEVASRQKALNFEPGTRWSYCNTGYNLAAIIVSRVSAMPFAEFCRVRIFEPLGMTRTSWRDDFRRVVKGRAIAYSDEGKEVYRQNMPFENAHGNGGLLTTVGDLLRWNENAVTRKVGDAAFLREEVQPGRLKDGTPLPYAMGLYVRTFLGLPEVSHDGATAGYRASLARYPEQRVSIAVLCNASSAAVQRYSQAVAAMYLGEAARTRALMFPGPAREATPAPALAPRAGLYRNVLTGAPLTILATETELQVGGLPAGENALRYNGEAFQSVDGGTLFFFGSGSKLRIVAGGLSDNYERVNPAKPTGAELEALAGVYSSDEAETSLDLFVDGGQLKLRRRVFAIVTLRPVYQDAFEAPGLGLVRFRRDAAGKATTLSVTTDRVWDLRFTRQ